MGCTLVVVLSVNAVLVIMFSKIYFALVLVFFVVINIGGSRLVWQL